MKTKGNLDECIGKVFDLYMENRLSDKSVYWYLWHMLDNTGKPIFSVKDSEKLVKMLKEAKHEV